MDNGTEVVSLTDKEGSAKSQEIRILEKEKALGLDSKYDSLIEASFLIDKPILMYALITGGNTKPERIFGDEIWEDYLDAKAFAKEHSNEPLSYEFIIGVHKRLTNSSPYIAGQIRRNGVVGGSYEDPEKPVTYTDEQIKAIENNPQLGFRRAGIPTSKHGFIVYPYSIIGDTAEQAIKRDLTKICDWYNEARKHADYDPIDIAARLQHRLISLHPFLDGNGRFSRLLMNWSLVNDGEAPSILDDPGEDILISEDDWVEKVKQGSNLYVLTKLKQLALTESGIDNINALFDSGNEKAFYDYIFKYLYKAPLVEAGGKFDHQQIKNFFASLKKEVAQCQSYLSATTEVRVGNENKVITQGGLISDEAIEFALAKGFISPQIRKQLYSDIEVYRGGVVTEHIDDNRLFQMFQAFTGVGTGYRALEKSYVNPLSTTQVNPSVIRESMHYYNQLFAMKYFEGTHPEIPNPYASFKDNDLSEIITDHVEGDQKIWKSPFASTSLDYNISRNWARFSSFREGPNGVVFRILLPREGIIETFKKGLKGVVNYGIGSEYEVLIAGGIHPASIMGIDVFDKDSQHRNPSLKAIRVEKADGHHIEIEDRRGQFVVVRDYILDNETQGYVLVDEQIKDTLSNEPVKEAVPIGHPQTYIPKFPDILTDQKGYISGKKHEGILILKDNLESTLLSKEKIGSLIMLLGEKSNIAKKGIIPLYETLESLTNYEKLDILPKIKHPYNSEGGNTEELIYFISKEKTKKT